jgi:phosphodiesterase/alkaline phosphatase D-like protein
MNGFRKIVISYVLTAIVLFSCFGQNPSEFSFILTSDPHVWWGRGDKLNRFRGVCEAISKAGRGDFMILAGDLHSQGTDNYGNDIRNYIGIDYIWYPVVGNHDFDDNGSWNDFKKYGPQQTFLPNIVSIYSDCPNTMYSFDYKNCHFVVINNFYDGTTEDAPCKKTDPNWPNCRDSLPLFDWSVRSWLKNDLSASTKQYKFVIGHIPVFRWDWDNDNYPEQELSLSCRPSDGVYNTCDLPQSKRREWYENRHAFFDILRDHGVIAYFCGHLHKYHALYIESDRVWQIQSPHSSGENDHSQSGFLKFFIKGENIFFDIYSADLNGFNYAYVRSVTLLNNGKIGYKKN